MEEQILLKGIKSKQKYILLLLCAVLLGLISLLAFLFDIVTMWDFLIRIASYLLLITAIILGLKVHQSYKNDEIYLTNEKIVLKRGTKTFEFPYEDIIKVRAIDTNIHGVISIRTKSLKKYIINNIENAKEFYFKYIEIRNTKGLPSEYDKENPFFVALMIVLLIAVLFMKYKQDDLANIPAPEFITQEVVK